MLAYIQLALDGSKEHDILEELQSFSEVKEAHILFGEWDVIAKLELPNPESLATFVLEKIRTQPGVKLTSTMIVAK